MKIKRYTAPSMRAALALVRAEQGPDAVILSSRRGEEGIEVIAAVDYDEALFAAANRPRAAAAVTVPQPTAPAAERPPALVRTASVDPTTPAAPARTTAPATGTERSSFA